MPQFFVMLSPEALQALGKTVTPVLSELDAALSNAVVNTWDVPGNDVACSAAALLYTHNEAPVQIEIRYTAGTAEYGRKKVFEPSLLQQAELIEQVRSIAERILDLKASVWTKPYYRGTFKGPG